LGRRCCSWDENIGEKMTDQQPFSILPGITGDFQKSWKTAGIPSTEPHSEYLGNYVCAGPADAVGVERGSNQQIEINFTGAPGTASGLYFALTFQLLKWQYNVTKVDEWIEVSPTHREYYERTLATKSSLEATIKEGLRSAAQAVADYELVKHDLRKYREIMDYFAAVEIAKKESDKEKRKAKMLSAEHVLKSMFMDQVDVHTQQLSLIEMARNRWPTIMSDFYALSGEDDTVEGIMKNLGISRAEAVVLKSKNTLFREWLKLFGQTVRDRYEMLLGLVAARKKSIEEYQEWIKPYISRYKSMKVGHERPEERKRAVTAFADLTGQASFSNSIRLWAFKPYRAAEYKKAPHVKTGEHGKFQIDPYDSWAKMFIKDPKRGLASIYPWLLNKGKKGDMADEIVDELKSAWQSSKIPGLDASELYYVLFEIDVMRLGLRLQVGELEDITFNIKTWVLSQNIMLVKQVERVCMEREIERYIEEMLGVKRDDKSMSEIMKTDYEDLFGKPEEKKPNELKKLMTELGEAVAGVKKAGGEAGKALGSHKGMFIKNGPYESDFAERITKQYLIPSGRMFGNITGLLMNKMGVG